jgi:hypothetical protein
MRTVLAILLVAVLGPALAGSPKYYQDFPMRFSVEIPSDTKISREENHMGRHVSFGFRDDKRREAVTLQAVRANNGGFGEPKNSVVKKIFKGMSSTLGKQPSTSVRSISYEGKELFATTHIGVGPGNGQTITSVLFLEEISTWRKIITIQFISEGPQTLSDTAIVERLKAIQFEPST